MEFRVLKCMESCQSSKRTDRKNSVKELTDLLANPEVVQVLNSNCGTDRVSWNALFLAANRSLILESESWKAEDAKGSCSAAARTTRENSKSSFASLVETILKKGNALKLAIKCDDVVGACAKIFSDPFLLKNFGPRFVAILTDNVLPVRRYRTKLKNDQWDELFHFVIDYLKTQEEDLMNWAMHCVIDLMERIVYHGCYQSHLSIHVKNKLLPYLEAKFITLFKNAALQDALLSLTLRTCISVGKETRIGVCHLGESILALVINLYDAKQPDVNVRNKLVIEFLLFQVKCHHPKGAKQGSAAAYACDWNSWISHMHAMYRVVLSTLLRREKTIGNHPLSDSFLELSVELCHQLFDKGKSSYEVSVTINETHMGPASKRRKCSISTQELFDELQSGRANKSGWPLVALLSRILQKHPNLFHNDELHQLADTLTEMQSNCSNQEMGIYVHQCSEHLVKVMAERNMNMDVWLKVWETALRSAGLNQSNCHPLLQALIQWRIPPTSGLESLIHMFQSSMISLSNDSLQTLMTLLTYYYLPESSGSVDSANTVALWELPINRSRVLLLEWLCSTRRNAKIDLGLLAKVLVTLVVKIRHNPQTPSATKSTSNSGLRGTTLETDFCTSAFEEGLLLPLNAVSLCSSSNPQANCVSSSIVDSISLLKLEMIMETQCVELEQKLASLEEDTPATQRARSFSTTVKSKMELTCDVINHACLMINMMSLLEEYGAIIDEPCLNNKFKRSMELVKVLLPQVLKLNDGPGESLQDVTKIFEVLECLRTLYGSCLSPSVSLYLREETVQEVLVPLVILFSWSGKASSNAAASTMPIILEGSALTCSDHIHACCLDILTLYGCPKQGTNLSSKQKSVITRILKVLADSELYDMSLESTFMMVHWSVSAILSYPCLDPDKHLIPILMLLQSVCKHWSQDAEASSYTLSLLKDIFKHASRSYERLCSTKLLSPFKIRMFGPKFTVQFISCMEELLRVDKNSSWAKWQSASSLRQAVDTDDISSEALRNFEDDSGNVAVVEDVIFFLLSPFYEVRLAAVSCVAGLLSGSHHTFAWMQTMFARLTVILSQLFNDQEETLYVEDILFNRTALVLHVLAAIIASSTRCYNEALLLTFRLVKQKGVNLDLTKRVFEMLVKPMKLESVQSFIGKSLPSILDNWLIWGHQLQEFPFVLLNLNSFSEFITHYKRIIMPLVWKHHDQQHHFNVICQRIKSDPVVLLEESFSSLFAHYLPFLAEKSSNKSVKIARQQYESFATLIGEDRIKVLISSKLDDILTEITNLVWDPAHHEILLGLDPSLTRPTPPCISNDSYSASLEYLQIVIQADIDLLVYIGRERPIVIQKVLMQLRENVCAAVTLDQSIKALHSYIFFAKTVAFHLGKGEYPNLGRFLLSDITHTLLHLIREYESIPAKLDVCIGSCCFLNIIYEQLLPDCAPILKDLLPTIVGFLVPLSLGTGTLSDHSLKLLKLLVVINGTHLREAISQLPPFPDAAGFEKINNIHTQFKYQDNVLSLEDEIKHFLTSTRSTNNLANLNTMFDGLNFMRKQLCEKKTELALMYRGLEETRGFSQDCKESVLHQLICKLVSLTASSDVKVRIEASRCLGELGPSELTTLVLKPIEGGINLLKGYSNPTLCVMVLAAHRASEYLLDPDIGVVKRASNALESIMACKGSDALHSKNGGSDVLKSTKIAPFIPKKATKPMPSLLPNGSEVVRSVCDDEIWCPSEEVNHKEWVTNLACSLITGLSDDAVFKDLANLCKVKTAFAEEMLPVLFYLGLSYSTDLCQKFCIRLDQFFENHCSSFKNSQMPNFVSCPGKIFLDKASVQCMLNVVNFVRLQILVLKEQKISFELNYLHIASAAQFCCAYLSSIMYLELWCNTEKRHTDFDGSNVAYIDYICETQPQEGKVLQNLLAKAYQQIGDRDALYGCGSSMLLNPKSRVNEYECIEKWDKVLLYYDAKLSHSKDIDAASGLVNALQHCGNLNLLNIFIESLPSDQKANLLPAQVECMWRLGKWGTPLSSSSKMAGFEWSQYSALEAIRDGNTALVKESVFEGRLNVLTGLAHSSLEICKTIYKPLAQLQALQEIEDFVTSYDVNQVTEKWKYQSRLPFSDIFLLELILAQRAKLMENLNFQKNEDVSFSQNKSNLLQTITQHYLDSAELARKEDQNQIAEQWLHSLSVMPHLSSENKRQIRFQEAQLAWSSCKGLNDVGNTSVARNLLKSLLKDLKCSEKESKSKSLLLPQALILYGKWLAEARCENPPQIIEDYLEEALHYLDALPSADALKEKIEAHCCLAHFADLEYQRITAYIKSESFQSKKERMETLRSEANRASETKQVKGEDALRDLRQAVTLGIKFSKIDEEEIKNTYLEQNQFIEVAMRHYIISMELGQGESLPVFRMVSLWLENASHDLVNDLVIAGLNRVQSYKFVVLLPQLAARLGDNLQNTFSKAIHRLLLRCCLEHPHHTLPLILALANSYEDFEGKVKPQPEARVVGATQMLSELRKNKAICGIVDEMDKIAKALISLAYAEIPAAGGKNGFSIPKTEKIGQLKNLEHAMLPIISLPVKSDAQYHDIINIQSFDTRYSIAGGLNKPKKVMCMGTDGVRRPLLVKGKDDLRQDAVMQQVFNIMNTLLKASKETNRQRLLIRTYKIVPLSQRCGVLEWCQNTTPLQSILINVHSKYYAQDWAHGTCMKKIENARQKSNMERLHVFKEICKNFHPAFRFFFTERFPTPAEWFDCRLAYVHSVATNSMVGYILGLGDRHVSNILIDETTAELIHIDFGIAFEQGKVLPTPETVPFRLTRDIVDGMGLSGVEGVFRRSCEKAMAVLRRNQEKILTILEVLLYDPLYAWTITPKMAAQRQSSSCSSVSSVSDVKVSSLEKNKVAERALCRLKDKLQGTEDGPVASIEGQVNRLIQQARDPSNLSRLFKGWQPYF